ncbi:MAG: hypothetical protein U9O94_05770 [Nanoarchaeota archaeon]|nr:hypothetical protein [Nanoarchaeota archaeon]
MVSTLNKKSQITIFIVLGIVIIIIFGLVFFVTHSSSDVLMEKKINKLYSDYVATTNIQEVTKNCLDKVSKEALELVGLQSGRIYNYQIKDGYNINYVIESCNYGECDVVNNLWCSDGYWKGTGFEDGEYCNYCGLKDSECPINCLPTLVDTCNTKDKKWCDGTGWVEAESIYCSKCGEVDSTCPVNLVPCQPNACDTTNKKWCKDESATGGTTDWEDSNYCGYCAHTDSSCLFKCTPGSCDTTSNKWCKPDGTGEGIWAETDYCANCGNKDSDCDLFIVKECDIDKKKWQDGTEWKEVGYCEIANCGRIDSTCNETCKYDVCDTKNNKWCERGRWTSKDYCGQCGYKDSSCAITCENDICDTKIKVWCNNGNWTNKYYCDNCNNEDITCEDVYCTNGGCDIVNKKFCDEGSWVESEYCDMDNCGDIDSYCSDACTSGTCHISNQEWCHESGVWLKEDYCNETTCGNKDSTCTFNAHKKELLDDSYTLKTGDTIPFKYEGNTYNIGYGIKAPKLDVGDTSGVFHPSAPYYPYAPNPNGPNSNSSLSFIPNPLDEFDTDHSFFALYKDASSYQLPNLCNELGENYHNTDGAEQSCETYSEHNTVQDYLRGYISENIELCVNLKSISEQGYNITPGNITAQALIGDEDVFVSLKYPITVTMRGKPPVTNYLNFNERIQVRLKKLHELAIHLIGYKQGGSNKPSADADNIFFDITEDEPKDCKYTRKKPRGGLIVLSNTTCKKEGMEIIKKKDYCLNNDCGFDANNNNEKHSMYSDIIILKDTKYMIEGKPYLFVFAIENRMPAVDYIGGAVNYTRFYYNYTCEGYGSSIWEGSNPPECMVIEPSKDVTPEGLYGDPPAGYDILNDGILPIEIFPYGLDPDEDELVYYYTGWEAGTAGAYPSEDHDNNNWQKSAFYTEIIISTSRGTPTDKYGFNRKEKNAIYSGDQGAHTLRITVKDNEGLYDYQDIKILIEP